MYSIKEKTVNEIIIKKSRFIGIAIPIQSEADAKTNLKKIKKEYLNATHYTYAYVIGDSGNIQKASDDGEPTRTAGYPILEVIAKNNLTNIILIVIRYFGGTKLGAGGLIRAYTSTAADLIPLCKLTQKTTTYKCSVQTVYDNIGNIDRFLRENTELLNVKYDSTIIFEFSVNKRNYDFVKEQLFQKNNFEDKLEIIDEYSAYV